MSDLAAVHGLGGKISYEAHVGLVLNIDRARGRRSWDVMLGLAWAASGTVPWEACRAQVGTDEEADRLYYESNKRRGK